jgi:hypothetical protein
MASTFERQSATRKFIYFGLILALFTGSLLHRKLVINAQADQLLLRDVSRGKADLTDSALRLTLSGVRGVAVTSLWLAAIEKQKRHEWNEMEVIVDSLTRLQPRFIAPWLFQGWNLAFNVAVECDRPRDKYYYITRGITLLCRGEEKNDPGMAEPPQPWPANPEMRFNVGFTYQLKIGQGDENKTLRCLYDLSCIPVAERSPDQFWKVGQRGKELDLEKFKLFCESHPRLVRRLRERLAGFEKPEAIVQFLDDNKDIPGRIEDRSKLSDDRRLEEFPILPPQHPKALSIYPYPNWREALGSAAEDFDVFVCTRAWYTYSQLPLPPENPDPGAREINYDRQYHQLPRMSTVIFRSYPARAEAYVAEELQKDGWFDEGGWRIDDWFDIAGKRNYVVVGTGIKYHSGEVWRKAYELYRLYGQRNGIYLEPVELKKLKQDAVRGGANSFAGKKLAGYESYRQMTNFEALFRQTEVERTAEAVAARKAIFEVEHTEAANPNVVSIYYDKVLPQWLDLLLRHPDFRQISTIQEETYELQAKYFKLLQYYNKAFFEKLMIGGAYLVPTWPVPGAVLPGAVPPLLAAAHLAPPVSAASTVGLLGSPGPGPLLAASALMAGKASEPSGRQPANVWPQAILQQSVEKKGIKVLYIRDVEGLFDQLFLLEGPEVEALKVAMALARSAVWPPFPTNPQTPDFAFARYVVWPPPAGAAGSRLEIGLGQQAVWPPTKALVSPDRVTAVAGGAMATACTPVFLMLSSAEQRRILTQVASHRHPPSGQGWTPLLPAAVVEMAREHVTWMRPRQPAPPPQPAPPQQ